MTLSPLAADVPPAAAPAVGYRGRFAPTPSGPLHLGSLATALASFLAARQAGGRWLLRIDDIDGPRCKPEHVTTILRQLDAHGLHWDEAERYQSQHLPAYEAAFQHLRQDGHCYRCSCTRARLAETSATGIDGPVYPGTCRSLSIVDSPGISVAWRVRVGAGEIALEDPLHGVIRRDLARDVGDFVIRRSDGRIGYQLACVVDEREQGITEVVRGADLIGSSLRQQLLMQHFGHAVPRYLHVPVLIDAFGQKLSKQNHAAPIHAEAAAQNLIRGLTLLGQIPFAADWRGRVDEILGEAIRRWNPRLIPHVLSLPAA